MKTIIKLFSRLALFVVALVKTLVESKPSRQKPQREGVQEKELKEPEVEQGEAEQEDIKPTEPKSPSEKREGLGKPIRTPIGRGGRPRGSVKERYPKVAKLAKPHPKQHDIICWKEERSWSVGIELQYGDGPIKVTQNGEPLTPSRTDEFRFTIAHLDIPVRVHTEKEGESIISIREKEQYLVFKMRKNWNDPGRLVKSITHGFYLVVTPMDWERDIEISGPADIAPEPVCVDGYCAHFFYRAKKSEDVFAFKTSGGEHVHVQLGDTRFRLDGTEIEDASEYMGPLYAQGPPNINTHRKKEWENVRCIVLGEEGRGRRKWRTELVPDIDNRIQNISGELASKRGGWYFARIYNKNQHLLESLDFRYMNGLKRIRTSKYEPLPGPEGHKPVKVNFYHESGLEVKLSKGQEDKIQIQREDEKTVVFIPPIPAWDMTDWKLRQGNAEIDVDILIERVRWSLHPEEYTTSKLPKDLRDRPIEVNRSYFRPTSAMTIHLWLPKPRWVDSVYVGPDEIRYRKYPIKVSDRYVSIHLRDFGDMDELLDKTQDAEIRLWIQINGSIGKGVTLCRIPAEFEKPAPPPPEPKPSPPEPIQEDPSSTASCSTCDHARILGDSIWCRRNHWPRIITWIFNRDYASNLCEEGRGEYHDSEGQYHVF